MTDYAPLRAAGLSVAPVPYGRKAPPPEGWDRWCITPPTDDELVAMFRGGPHNIAVLCGPASGGLVVLVFNDRGLYEAFTAGVTPPTWIAESVRGQHIYVRINGELPNTTYWTSRRTGKLAVLELRSTGAYVIAPPSKHPDGPRYVWAHKPEYILELDADDFECWLEQGLANAWAHSWPLERTVDRVVGAGAGAATTVEGDITEGARDVTLTSLAGSMRRRGFSEGAILAALRVENADRCKPPLAERDVERIARSVSRYPSDEHICPTCGWSNVVAPVLKRAARTVTVG